MSGGEQPSPRHPRGDMGQHCPPNTAMCHNSAPGPGHKAAGSETPLVGRGSMQSSPAPTPQLLVRGSPSTPSAGSGAAEGLGEQPLGRPGANWCQTGSRGDSPGDRHGHGGLEIMSQHSQSWPSSLGTVTPPSISCPRQQPEPLGRLVLSQGGD